MSLPVDLKLNTEKGYYDISFQNSGDFNLTQGLDTAIFVSLMTNSRALPSEVPAVSNREGWWGNAFMEDREDIGSKLFLVYNSSLQDLTINEAIDYTKKALNWLINKGFADTIQVRASKTIYQLSITVRITKDGNVTETVFNLWDNTRGA